MIDLSGYRGQTIAVMGLGKSGLASARALKQAGVRVLAWDDEAGRRDAAAREGIAVSDLSRESWKGIDLLVLSPGIPHSHPAPHPVAALARANGRPIVGDIELLAHASPAARYIGITGTNGKSTTTSLIGHLLKKAGRQAAVGGNLGMPALEFEPMGKDGYYVIEMSSYQLELTAPIPFNAAILLNVTPDHLDRHGGMGGYIAAKKRIFDGQGAADAAVIGVDDDICRSIHDALRTAKHQRVVPISGDRRVSGGVYAVDSVLYDDTDGGNAPVIALDEIRTLPGTHNAQNASAAYAAARMSGLSPEEIGDAMRSFPGLAHRQELAAEIDGVLYINDSKATNAEAAARALSSYHNIYWIIGGLPKDGGLAAAKPFFDRVRHAFLIGQAAAQFRDELAGVIPTTMSETLDAAVSAAHEKAQREQRADAVVLLSPACASFDQFANFEERGRQFCRLVAALPGSARNIRGKGAAA
jgi:UDP-N-acetylmuramoylalanine--D-glutamate ligase